MGRIAADLTRAYADNGLYNNALEKVNSAQRVKQLLGKIKPIERLAILKGEVEYSNGNKSVHSTIRIVGTKGKAKMDISANGINNVWNYNKINIRIENPPEKKQTIAVIIREQYGRGKNSSHLLWDSEVLALFLGINPLMLTFPI